jgi:hypothetical protein
VPPILLKLGRRLFALLRLLGPLLFTLVVLLETKDYLVGLLGLSLFQILLVPAILGAAWLGIALGD